MLPSRNKKTPAATIIFDNIDYDFAGASLPLDYYRVDVVTSKSYHFASTEKLVIY